MDRGSLGAGPKKGLAGLISAKLDRDNGGMSLTALEQ